MFCYNFSSMGVSRFVFSVILSYVAAVNLPSVRDNVGLTRPYHIYEGDDALITCVVSNVGDNTVTWKKEDRERHSRRVLTAGENRVTGDKRFSILHDKGGDVWVLVIKNANSTDSGIYVCEVNSNPIVRSFHKLNVLSRALQPPENTSVASFVFDSNVPKFDAKSHNYTDCCMASNVTASCLGFCNIQSILEGNTGQDPENCENDFPEIVKCMADRRNHVPCCIQEKVPDICQDVCRGEYTVITDNIKTHFSCSAYTEQTLACIVEGIELLPSVPENVEVEPLSETVLNVSWESPESNAHTVTAYLVNVTTLRTFDEEEEDSYAKALEKNRKDEMQAKKSQLERKQIEVPSSLRSVKVTSLKPFTMYEITVTAKNDHGTSLPSFAIRSVTLPSGVVKSNTTTVSPKLPDIKACCVEKGVSHTMCLDKLCDPGHSDIAAVTDLMICAPWAAITFSCLTIGADLSPCCKARGLPESCQVLCTGNVTQIDFSYFKCLKYMNDFSSCLFQSYGVLPSEPVGLRVSNLNPDFAIIHWKASKTLPETILHYNLHYRLLATYDNDYKIVSKVHSPFVLEKLQNNADYEVYVEAVNVHGTSEPSSRIVFKTKSKIIENKIEESNLYNVTECCISSGLANICLPLCSYDASMVDIKNLAGICGPEFHKLIRCGAGGRNHEKCCARRGVPGACLTLCSGTIVDSLLVTATTCIPYIGNIVQCFEEGTGLLPGPVNELHATAVTENSVSVEWEPPPHSNVTDYVVFYDKVENVQESGSKSKIKNQMNTTNTSLTLNELEKNKIYKIFVISRNQHGTSLSSSILMINVTKSNLDGGSIKGVPSSPHSLAVSSHSANWVTISWQPPQFSHFAETIIYRLYHKPASETDFQVVETTLTSHMLDGLSPNTQYIAYVVAVSKAGSSLPSETLIAWTDPAYPAFVEPPTVHPINLVIEGSSMTILCIAMGTPMPTISLYISGRLVRQETTRHMVTVIHNVTRDMDQISCYADNGYGTPMQASRKITISHVPHIVASGITIAGIGDTVSLECQVDAHPEPKMLFWRDISGRVPVIQGGKHSIKITKSPNEESKWIMGLVIQDISDADAGDYFCHAENAFGSATQAVSVRIRKEASIGNVTQCCEDLNVSSSCIDACTFFVDMDVVIDKPECLGDFDKLMKCAADGSDHRSCCGQRGVPRRCLDWCRGEPLFNNKMCVLSYTKQIMSCFQEGREKLPGPPQNVRIEPIDSHSVYIKWDPPLKNPHTVVMYRIFWRQLGSKIPMKNDTKETRLKISGLKEGVTYECVIKAGNHIGTSMLTEPFKFTTGDKYVTSASSIDAESSSVGVVVGIVLAVLIVAAIFVGSVYFLRVKRMLGRKSSGGVAFENPSYLREVNADRVQGSNQTSETLPISHLNGISNTVAPEGTGVTPQQGWKQESLHVPQSTEVPPSLYEELKLGQDGVGFKRLKP